MRAATLLTALVASLALAAPAHAVPKWLAPVNVAGPTDQPVDGIVSTAPNGTTMVAYTQFSGGFSRLVVRVRPPGRGFGAPMFLSPTNFNAHNPSIGVDQAGNFTVAWRVDDPTAEIKAARLGAGAAAFGPTETVSTGPAGAVLPIIGVGGNGTAVIAYLQDTTVKAAIRQGADGQFSDGATISDTGADTGYHDVGVDDGGNAVVTWSRHLADRDLVEASERPAGLGFPPPVMARVLSSNATGEKNTEPALAVAPNGRAIVVWRLEVGGVADIRFSERAANGAAWSAAQKASKPGDEPSRFPHVAIAANGNAVGAWTATVGGTEFIQGAVHSPGAASFTGHQAFPSTTTGVPVVEGNRRGDTVIAWGGFSGEAVLAVRRPAGGGFSGVDTIGLGTQGTADPAISLFFGGEAVDDQGNMFAVWRRNAFSSSAMTNVYHLQIASFDNAAPQFSAVAVPAAGNPNAAIGMAAAASDRLANPTLSWNFGDGSTATGGAVSHAYARNGAYTVTVTASDAAGNATSQSRPVVISPVAGPPRIRSKVLVTWGVAGKRIFLLRMKVKSAFKGMKAQLRCKGKRCPYRKFSSKRVRKRTITLFKPIKPADVLDERKRSFRAGQRLQVRLTAPGFIGRVVKYRLRADRIPNASAPLCLPPGASKPRKRC